MKKYICLLSLVLLASLTFDTCAIDPICAFPYDHASLATTYETYLINTLEYPIIVQSYYVPFHNNMNWASENEEKTFGSPVTIQPGEAKVIMDYVHPTRIVIWADQTGDLLYEYQQKAPFQEMYPIDDTVLKRIVKPDSSFGFLPVEAVLLDLEHCQYGYYWNASFEKNDRYLSQNIDWEEYPIWYQFSDVNRYFFNSIYPEEERLSRLEEDRLGHYLNGYTLVQFLTTNNAAACFQRK